MKCVNCGEQLNEGCVFCSKCGKEVQWFQLQCARGRFSSNTCRRRESKETREGKREGSFEKRRNVDARQEHNKKIMITVVSVSIALVVILIVVVHC